MRGLRKVLPITVVLALFLALLPGVALGDDTAGVTTKFTANNPPTVVGIALRDATDGNDVYDTAGMVPGTTYTLRVAVSDADGYGDISKIDIAVFYANAADTEAPTTSDLDTTGVFQWVSTAATNLTVIGTGGTWAGSTGGVTKTTTDTTQALWRFPFTVGKIAKEALGQTAEAIDGWHFYAKVTDSQSATGDLYNRGSSDKGWAMAWYGEIGSSVTADVDFGTVPTPSTDFTQISKVDSSTATSFSIYSMANGTHNLTVKASSITGISFASTDSPGSGALVLTMDVAASSGALSRTAGQRLSTGAVDITGYTSVATTSDTLNNVSNTDFSSMWIKLGSGITTGAYETTVTYTIANA